VTSPVVREIQLTGGTSVMGVSVSDDNKSVYASCSASGLIIINITNIANLSIPFPAPIILSTAIVGANPKQTIVRNNIAYITSGSAAAQSPLVDISIPATPVIKGTLPSIGAAGDLVFGQNRIYFTDGSAELVIADIYHDALSATISPSVNSAKSGDQVTYTLQVTNSTPNVMTGIVISSAALPSNVTYAEGSASNNGALNSNKIVWPSIPFIAPGISVTYTYSVRVK